MEGPVSDTVRPERGRLAEADNYSRRETLGLAGSSSILDPRRLPHRADCVPIAAPDKGRLEVDHDPSGAKQASQLAAREVFVRHRTLSTKSQLLHFDKSHAR